jgi:hypothetical protein
MAGVSFFPKKASLKRAIDTTESRSGGKPSSGMSQTSTGLSGIAGCAAFLGVGAAIGFACGVTDPGVGSPLRPEASEGAAGAWLGVFFPGLGNAERLGEHAFTNFTV